MAKLSDKQWMEIKTKYQLGKPIREIAREYDYDAGNLTKKAKKDGWVHGELQHLAAAQINAINEITKTTAEIQHLTTPEQQEVITNEVMCLAGLKQKTFTMQNKLVDLVSKITTQAVSLVENNPNGLHIKSQSDTGITYARNSEIIKDFTPVINGINALLSPKPDITINNNQQNNTLSISPEYYPDIEHFVIDRNGNIKLDEDGTPVNPDNQVMIYLPNNGR